MWLDILSGISIIVLACIIGILFPMITSINESLINRKKKVKKVNIHSSHRLNPFTLALRHNYIYSLRNIIYIIIMVTSIYIFVSNIYFSKFHNSLKMRQKKTALTLRSKIVHFKIVTEKVFRLSYLYITF